MPISTFMGLQTSLRGLLAHQQAIDTTSHNVANANTDGYSRQIADMTPTEALKVIGGTGEVGRLGSGVTVEGYRRIRDAFLDLQYRAQNMQVGDQSTRSTQLDQVELALSEPGDNGIASQLAKFWNGWSDLSNSPDDIAARQALIEQAKNLAASFKTVDTQLTTVKSQASAEYASLTGPAGDVAAIAKELATLNGAIKQFTANGDQPNDLMDRRDLLLDKLSNLAQVRVVDYGNGSMAAFIGDATSPLVDDTTTFWPQTLNAPGGKLGALIAITKTGGVIDSYRADLNAVVKNLADSVNSLHNPGGAGTNFFNYTAGAEGGSLAVNVTTATVRTSTTSAAGANDIARS